MNNTWFWEVTDAAIENANIKKQQILDNITKMAREIVKERIISINDENYPSLERRIILEDQENHLAIAQDRIKNFDLDYAVETNSRSRFLVNSRSFSDVLPFHKVDNFIVVGRDDDISIDMMSIKRIPKNVNRYLNILSVSVYEGVIEDLKQSNIEQNEFDLEEIAKKLFLERVDKQLVDIFGMLDEEQQKIIKRFNGFESIWVRGFAGSGKTVIANELLAKSKSQKRKVAIYANRLGAAKAREFFASVEVSNIDVFTYNELENIIEENIMNKLITLGNEMSEFKTLEVFNETHVRSRGKVTSLFVPSLELLEIIDSVPSFDLEGRATLKVIEFLINTCKFNEKFYDAKWLEVFISKIKNSKNKIKNLYKNKKLIESVYDVEVGEYFKVGNSLDHAEFILLDETPVLLKSPLLSNVFRKKTVEFMNGFKFIHSFDELQYSEFDMNNIWKYVHFDRKEYLEIVYRTTREIFNASISKKEMVKNFKVPVSIKDSFTTGEQPLNGDKVIKLSSAISNPELFIGVEYENLSIEIDVEVDNKNAHVLYMIMTRAVRKLNIFGKYAGGIYD